MSADHAGVLDSLVLANIARDLRAVAECDNGTAHHCEACQDDLYRIIEALTPRTIDVDSGDAT